MSYTRNSSGAQICRSTTHHEGCLCHEQRHAEEIARLTAERYALAEAFTACLGDANCWRIDNNRDWLAPDPLCARAIERARLTQAVVDAARDHATYGKCVGCEVCSAVAILIDAHDKEQPHA